MPKAREWGGRQGREPVAYPPQPVAYDPTEQERIDLQTATRQALVSEHHIVGHPGGYRRAGCPYCYAPGPNGDYMPVGHASATRERLTLAQAFMEADAP